MFVFYYVVLLDSIFPFIMKRVVIFGLPLQPINKKNIVVKKRCFSTQQYSVRLQLYYFLKFGGRHTGFMYVCEVCFYSLRNFPVPKSRLCLLYSLRHGIKANDIAYSNFTFNLLLTKIFK